MYEIDKKFLDCFVFIMFALVKKHYGSIVKK